METLHPGNHVILIEGLKQVVLTVMGAECEYVRALAIAVRNLCNALADIEGTEWGRFLECIKRRV